MEKQGIKFQYPFTPYSNQLEYSKQLYDIIDNGNIGILESPTGTVINEFFYHFFAN